MRRSAKPRPLFTRCEAQQAGGTPAVPGTAELGVGGRGNNGNGGMICGS